jgi:hypothetical protein
MHLSESDDTTASVLPTPSLARNGAAPKRIRKPRTKPAPPTLAQRIAALALDPARPVPEAFDLNRIADAFARIERLATRTIAPLDGLDTGSERGYLYFQALLVEALR